MLREIKEGILLSLPGVCFFAIVVLGMKAALIIFASIICAYQMFKILDKDDFSNSKKCYKIGSGEKTLKI